MWIIEISFVRGNFPVSFHSGNPMMLAHVLPYMEVTYLAQEMYSHLLCGFNSHCFLENAIHLLSMILQYNLTLAWCIKLLELSKGSKLI